MNWSKAAWAIPPPLPPRWQGQIYGFLTSCSVPREVTDVLARPRLVLSDPARKSLSADMPYIHPPTTGFVSGLEQISRRERAPRYRSANGRRIYVWDGLHGELEVYNKQGVHMGAVDPSTGVFIKDAVRGRTIDV